MSNISPSTWVKNHRYRPRFLGWFVSSILLVLLAHLALFIGLIITGVGILPLYMGIFFLLFSLISVEVFVYFLVRMLAPAEHLGQAVNSTRRIVVWALIGGVLLVQVLGVASRYLFNVSPEALHPIAPLIAILFYSTAIAVGYDSARSKNALDRMETLSLNQVDGSPLLDVLSGKSEKKALGAVCGCLVIGLVVWPLTSPITGLTTAASIATLLALGIQLYPDGE